VFLRGIVHRGETLPLSLGSRQWMFLAVAVAAAVVVLPPSGVVSVIPGSCLTRAITPLLRRCPLSRSPHRLCIRMMLLPRRSALNQIHFLVRLLPFAAGLDKLHESVQQSMGGLVEVEFHVSAEGYVHEITQAVADVYNNRTMKLEEYEQILKHDYVTNDKVRAEMQSQLEASATAARTMFEELMARVMESRPLAASAVASTLSLKPPPH
jgi:hypothetical protein